MARKPKHPVTAYAEAVTEGRVLACELVRLACERHLKDLQAGRVRGLRFDEAAADHAMGFFRFLRHSKGEWAGCRFDLEPWQQFIVGSIFGWLRADGARRFRTAYIEIPRKNGKSTLAAGIGLYLFVADGEPGAEVYAAATKEDQARIVWSEAARMVRKSPELKKRIKIYDGAANMHILATAAKFEALSADADTNAGHNVHGAIIDELHAHKTRAIWDILDTATGSRRQPLILAITTAGTDWLSVCYEQHEYVERILKGMVQDDSYFGFISTLDAGDDWSEERSWRKANPNYGISVKPDDLRKQCEQALAIPSKQNAFLRFRLNVWTQQADRWISLPLWDAQAGMVIEEELEGRTCYGGLDLSSVSDITAWVMVFPRDQDPEEIDVLCRFWVPEARLNDRQNRYRDQYRAWVKHGYLRVTPGDAVDYGFIKKQILEDAAKFRLVDLNIDRLFQGYQIGMELQEEGLTVVGMGQGFTSMGVPMKEFERRLLARKIHHGGNPVLRFMADSVVVKQDAAGNLKIDKANSQARVDGIVALVMALDRAMRHQKPQKSVYEERGIIRA